MTDETRDRLADALRLIDRNGCERLTRGRCYDDGNGLTRGARYGADDWCDPCVASHALAEAGLR